MSSCEVAVIGAGAAGLVTARELRRQGHAVVVFEQNENVGGVWNYSEEVEEDLLGRDPNRERIHSSLYASVRTNLPREIMSFSDFPFIPEAMLGKSVDSRRFCKHEEVQRYLEAFAVRFDILPLIQFDCRVLSVRPLSEAAEDGRARRWKLTWKQQSSNSQEEKEYDAVVCCVGTYSQPNVPSVRGMDCFPGRQLHCHNFRHAAAFRGQRVLVVGASFSGDEIARLVAREAVAVHHTARTWASEQCNQLRDNLERMAWLAELTDGGEAVFEDGTRQCVDSVIYCTGYRYCFPFLEGTGLVSTDEGHVHPVFKHIFLPSDPTLCFVGLLWKSLRFPQFELQHDKEDSAQAKLVARVLAGSVQLPSKAEMEADVAAFYQLLSSCGLPIRYAHSQADVMPVDQWQYNASLARLCGPDVLPPPGWQQRLHSATSASIFGRPETFRDAWTVEEQAAFADAQRECQRVMAKTVGQ